jgi:hypothetical protein
MDNEYLISSKTTSSSRPIAVFVMPFQYTAFGTTHTLMPGDRFKVGKRYGFINLVDGVLTIVAGHGAEFPVPKEYYHLEVETTRVTRSVSRRPA